MWKFQNRKQSPSEEELTEKRRSLDISKSGGGGANNSNHTNNTECTEATEATEVSTTQTAETQTIDALLAKELNSLSFQQRESINEEIHGINVNQIYFDKIKDIEETPELLKESFKKLQIELNKLQPNSFAYHRCQQLYGDNNDNDKNNDGNNNNDDYNANYENVDDNNDNNKHEIIIRRSTAKASKATKAKVATAYVNTDEFRMIFLRCELFDATKAAQLLVNYVELIYELYGDLALQRRIRLEDLSNDELQIMKAGSFQILPGRDRAGRRILMHIAHNATNKYTWKSRCRIYYYLQMCLADDVETQRKGCVQITWYHNVNMFGDFSTRTRVYKTVSSCLLVRSGAIHVCITGECEGNYSVSNIGNGNESSSDSRISSNYSTTTTTTKTNSPTPVNIIKSMIALSLGARLRSKIRIHTGSVMECVYALQSFGIPSNQIPLVVGTNANKKKRRKNFSVAAIGEKNNENNNGNSNSNSINGNSNSNHLKLDNHTKWLQLCQLKDNNMKLYGKKWKYHDDDYRCGGNGGGGGGCSIGGFAIDAHNGNGQQKQKQQITECPKHSDILSGRGRDIMRHPGNTVFRSIIVSKLDEYLNLKSYQEKVTLTMDIVHLLKNKYGARFLKEETTESNNGLYLGCWVEVSNDDARMKVRVSFRDKIKKLQKLKNQKELSVNIMEDHQISIPTTTICTTDESCSVDNNNNNYSNKNNNAAGAIIIATNNNNNTTNNMQLQNHKQLTSSLKTSVLSTIHVPTSLIPEQQDGQATNYYNSNNRYQQQQQQQIQHQQVNEDTDSSTTTSMFLSMTSAIGSDCGSNSNSSSSSICSSSTDRKKRQLYTTKVYTSCFDCVNNF